MSFTVTSGVGAFRPERARRRRRHYGGCRATVARAEGTMAAPQGPARLMNVNTTGRPGLTSPPRHAVHTPRAMSSGHKQPQMLGSCVEHKVLEKLQKKRLY